MVFSAKNNAQAREDSPGFYAFFAFFAVRISG